jgi:hypothetical protein
VRALELVYCTAELATHLQLLMSWRIRRETHSMPVRPTYLSSSFRYSSLKLSSQPTSIRILVPPSSSSKDCDAEELDWAPRSDVKLNMAGGK